MQGVIVVGEGLGQVWIAFPEAVGIAVGESGIAAVGTAIMGATPVGKTVAK